MKFKKTSLFVTSALYAAGMANASATTQDTYTIKPIELSVEAVKARTQSVAAQDPSFMLEGNGLNVQMQPTKKFVREADVEGANQYIIRLKDAPAALYEGDAQGVGATKPLLPIKHLVRVKLTYVKTQLLLLTSVN